MEKNKELVAYCGLYCGDCFNYRGEIADLARDLRKKLREAKFADIAPELSRYFKEFKDFQLCYQALGAMVRLRCKKGCCSGGGNPFCKIKICCRKKELAGCWECKEFEVCNKFDFLRPVHNDINLKNVRKIRQRGMEVFLQGLRDSP